MISMICVFFLLLSDDSSPGLRIGLCYGCGILAKLQFFEFEDSMT